ncbi:sigma factor regulatory protein, FecR/PupR family, partial [Ostertagia ostertagi]
SSTFAPGACSTASHIGLEESGAKYDSQALSFAKSEQRTLEYLKVNPRGRVPALVVDEGTIVENTAIPRLRRGDVRAPPDADGSGEARPRHLADGLVLQRRASELHPYRASRALRHRYRRVRSSQGGRSGELPRQPQGDRRSPCGQDVDPGRRILRGRRLRAGLLRLGQAHRPAGRGAEELHGMEGSHAGAAGREARPRARAERLAGRLTPPVGSFSASRRRGRRELGRCDPCALSEASRLFGELRQRHPPGPRGRGRCRAGGLSPVQLRQRRPEADRQPCQLPLPHRSQPRARLVETRLRHDSDGGGAGGRTGCPGRAHGRGRPALSRRTPSPRRCACRVAGTDACRLHDVSAGGPNAPADAGARAGLDAWLASSDAHRRAYRSVERVWTLTGELPSATPASAGGIVDLSRVRRKRRTWALAAAVLAACVALWTFPSLKLRLQADHLTGVAELRELTLEDGSIVHLDADSAIAVRYDKGRREVALLAGQAFFKVVSAHDRPFVVTAGNVAVTVKGTAFDVGSSRDGVSVAVQSGTVEQRLLQNSRSIHAITQCSPVNAQLVCFLDEALRRRFEQRIYIPLPDKPARLSLLCSSLKEVRIADDVDLETFAEQLEGYSGADITNVCRKAALMGVKRLTRMMSPAEIAKLSREEVDLPITWQDLQEAFNDTNPSVSDVSRALISVV